MKNAMARRRRRVVSRLDVENGWELGEDLGPSRRGRRLGELETTECRGNGCTTSMEDDGFGVETTDFATGEIDEQAMLDKEVRTQYRF